MAMAKSAVRGRAENDARAGIFPGIEAVSAFIFLFLLIKYLETTWFGFLQSRLFGWDFFAHFAMVAIPVFMLRLSGEGIGYLGLSKEKALCSENIKISLLLFAATGAVWALTMAAPMTAKGMAFYLLLPPHFFAENIIMNETAKNVIGWSLTVIFSTVFCGLGEEIFFRGYMQGRLNDALGRPFSILGVRFGWGLVIVSLIFGVGHGLNYFNPFVGSPAYVFFDHLPAVVTAVQGILFGLIYERTGGVLAPACVHAGVGLFYGSMTFQAGGI